MTWHRGRSIARPTTSRPTVVDFVMFIRYLDHYRRDGDVWRFAERETFVEWTEERAPASRA